MKDFSFKNEESILKTLSEPKLKKKKWSMDRITYLLVIGLVLYFSISFLYKRVNLIKANGQIVFDKTIISFTEDIIMEDIYIYEGKEIKETDTLFSYFKTNKKSEQELEILVAQSKLNSEQKLQQIELSIQTAKEMKTLLQKQWKQLQQDKEKIKKYILLEIATYKELENLQKKETELVKDIRLNQIEISNLTSSKKIQKENIQLVLDSYQSKKYLYYFKAPTSGISGQLNYSEKETCYKQKEVLTIHNPQKVSIKAYFTQSAANYLEKDTKVSVHFADGTKSKGILSYSYISTYAIPSEFQKKYEPTERSILVNIKPINKKEEAIWKKYYLMDVSLQIHKIL